MGSLRRTPDTIQAPVFLTLTLTDLPLSILYTLTVGRFIDWWVMVVEGGNVLHHVKREGDMSWRGMSEGICLCWIHTNDGSQ